jgi:Cu(I)/Ag(I) efflux system membrane fusion protein
MKARITALLLALLWAAPPVPAGPAQADDEREILYWVAPMDPNYRRDKPGKSPMGMDLVPVYADSAGDSDTVRIDPAMVENLGVRTALVERGPLWRRIDTVGYVAFDERRISHIHMRTDGWIEKLYVKSNGERVKKGDLLFELYSPDLVNAQEEYVQALRGSSDYLRQASRERLEALGVSGGQIRQVKKSRHASQRVKIYAPQDGMIDSLNVREGMYVKPATEVMALADLSSVWLLVDIFERQSDWVAPRVEGRSGVRLSHHRPEDAHAAGAPAFRQPRRGAQAEHVRDGQHLRGTEKRRAEHTARSADQDRRRPAGDPCAR